MRTLAVVIRAVVFVSIWGSFASMTFAADIHEAAKNGNLIRIEEILKANPDLVNEKDTAQGGTPLHYASGFGQIVVVKFLIERGADVNIHSKNGSTPLHVAVEQDFTEIVKLLIDAGADVNAKGQENATPLHYAVGRGFKDIAELLISNEADLTAKDRYGETPLQCATSHGHGEMVSVLMAKPSITPKKPEDAMSSFLSPDVSFDYPAFLTIPPKTCLDIDKVKEMQKPYGVELLTLLMSSDQRTVLQLGRSKKDATFDSLYKEKKDLASQINSSGVSMMGEQFTKFTVEKLQLSGSVPALFEYGEKANGEVAFIIEFLKNGYDYALLFIYKNRYHAEAGAKERAKVVKSIKIKTY